MDPLSIPGTAFGLAVGIAKASVAIVGFSRDVRDASKDLDTISTELQALTAILDPLARGIPRANTSTTPLPEALAVEINTALDGCTTVVEQIVENIKKYKCNKISSNTTWAVWS